MQRRFLRVVLVATWLVLPDAASAGGAAPGSSDLARQRYQKGAQAYSERRYKDAIDHFLEANRVSPNPAFAYNVGLAYEDLGDADNALMWYRKYLRDLPDAPDRKEVAARITAAEGHLRARGVQQVTILSTPTAATVSIDGERVGVTPWTGQIKPGNHRIEAELRGYQDAAEMMELPSDHAIDFGVTLRPSATPSTTAIAPRVTSASEPRAQPAARSSGGVHWYTWGALGLGAAGFAAAAVFEAARSSAVDDARHASTNLEGKELYDRAKTDQLLGRVALIGGSAFAVAGVVLLYVDLSSSGSESSTRAAVDCGPSNCRVMVHGHF